MKNSLKRLKVLQKRVSRKHKYSKNREKAKQRLVVLHDSTIIDAGMIPEAMSVYFIWFVLLSSSISRFSFTRVSPFINGKLQLLSGFNCS
ncbi:Mobile element protein [Methanosarcina sp. WWM596]|nr:Mobile element protein [Methanosarcina sp. WWM596]AKB22442.1 Mobile element protein [Methanosarcina sp. WH1]